MRYSNDNTFDMLCNIGVIPESKEYDTELFDDCKYFSSKFGCVLSKEGECFTLCPIYERIEENC